MSTTMEAVRTSDAGGDEGFRFYWITGCSSCQRTKEFLLREGVTFESINLAETPERRGELAELGIRSVPVVVQGKRFSFAQDLADVARFVGVNLAHRALPPAQLAAKMDEVLISAIASAGVMPADRLGESISGRERPHRDLIFHIFHVGDVFLKTMNGAPASEQGFFVYPAKDVTPQQLADYGEDVRARFKQWWAAETDREGQRLVETIAGPKPMIVVLERATWHAAHHTRQLELKILGGLGIAPPHPLSAATIAGLPMPETVF